MRASLSEIHGGAKLDPQSKALMYKGMEIGVIYFRAGYQPEDYTSEKDWDARLMMERSAAVKCPSIAYHCVGAKKIQGALTRQGMVEKYVSASSAARLRTVFAGMYTLGDGSAEAEAAKDQALATPGAYVLKPQREGGGNNLYDKEMVQMLSTATDEELEAYILMDIIKVCVLCVGGVYVYVCVRLYVCLCSKLTSSWACSRLRWCLPSSCARERSCMSQPQLSSASTACASPRMI